MNADTLFLFSYCLEYALLFLDDNMDEECEYKQKSNLRVLLSIWVIFCQFHSAVSYKSVTYKKHVYYVKLKILCKQRGSGLSPQSYLSFQGFQSSKLLNDCLVVWHSNLCFQGIQ